MEINDYLDAELERFSGTDVTEQDIDKIIEEVKHEKKKRKAHRVVDRKTQRTFRTVNIPTRKNGGESS